MWTTSTSTAVAPASRARRCTAMRAVCWWCEKEDLRMGNRLVSLPLERNG
jgi:hypothetical protein